MSVKIDWTKADNAEGAVLIVSNEVNGQTQSFVQVSGSLVAICCMAGALMEQLKVMGVMDMYNNLMATAPREITNSKQEMIMPNQSKGIVS